MYKGFDLLVSMLLPCSIERCVREMSEDSEDMLFCKIKSLGVLPRFHNEVIRPAEFGLEVAALATSTTLK
jgi:hypothetical protein